MVESQREQKISKEQFRALARLSRLSFSEEEEEQFIAGFEEMMTFCDGINSEIEGDASSIREVDAREIALGELRADEVVPSLPNEKILSNVHGERGYFAVKRVVK